MSNENQALAGALDERIGCLSAQAHAAMAGVAIAAAEFDQIGGWCAAGICSFPHWLTINVGFDPQTGKELLRVGIALRELPRIAAAFLAGQLSFDKICQVTTVATPDTDELMLEIARGASGSQLARICRSLRRMTRQREQKQLVKRGLWSDIDEDGMMRLVARLTAEDGAVVMAAIESVTGSKPMPNQSDDEAVHDPAENRWAARRADALVAMAEHILSGAAGDLVVAGEARQVIVHVDVGVLTGEAPDGLCQLENGAPLSAAAARRIGCDAEIVPVIERNGLPIDVGRNHRTAPPRLRRALEIRDRFCTFPGCCVPARQTHSHHLEHWVLGGPTTLANMILLCGFHHRAYHDGGYGIVKVGGGRVRFETNDGRVIGERALEAGRPYTTFRPDAALAEWGGERMDLDHTMFVLEPYFPSVDSRAGPPN